MAENTITGNFITGNAINEGQSPEQQDPYFWIKQDQERRKTETAKLIEGETFSLAAASLQEMVKGIITSRGGVISSERMGKEEDMTPGALGPGKEVAKSQKPEKGPKPRKEKSEDKSRFKFVNVSFDFGKTIHGFIIFFGICEVNSFLCISLLVIGIYLH